MQARDRQGRSRGTSGEASRASEEYGVYVPGAQVRGGGNRERVHRIRAPQNGDAKFSSSEMLRKPGNLAFLVAQW